MNPVQSREDARYVNDLLDQGIDLEQAHAQLEVMQEQFSSIHRPGNCYLCNYPRDYCQCDYDEGHN